MLGVESLHSPAYEKREDLLWGEGDRIEDALELRLDAEDGARVAGRPRAGVGRTRGLDRSGERRTGACDCDGPGRGGMEITDRNLELRRRLVTDYPRTRPDRTHCLKD